MVGMTVDVLRKECSGNGLPTRGSKYELLQRLGIPVAPKTRQISSMDLVPCDDGAAVSGTDGICAKADPYMMVPLCQEQDEFTGCTPQEQDEFTGCTPQLAGAAVTERAVRTLLLQNAELSLAKDAAESQVQKLNAELSLAKDAVESQEQKFNAFLADAQIQVDSVLQENDSLKELHAQLADLQIQVDSLLQESNSLKELNAQLADLQTQVDSLLQESNSLKEKVPQEPAAEVSRLKLELLNLDFKKQLECGAEQNAELRAQLKSMQKWQDTVRKQIAMQTRVLVHQQIQLKDRKRRLQKLGHLCVDVPLPPVKENKEKYECDASAMDTLMKEIAWEESQSLKAKKRNGEDISM